MIYGYSLELDEFLKSWEKFQETPGQEMESSPLFWTYGVFTILINFAPELAYHAILRALQIISIPIAIESLSAGPLEDLLGKHGDLLIDKVEQEAQSNEKFRGLLRGMYQGRMSDELWTRVQAAAVEKTTS